MTYYNTDGVQTLLWCNYFEHLIPVDLYNFYIDNLIKEKNMLSTHDYVGDINDEQKAYCEKIREAFKLVEAVILEHPSNLARDFSARCLALARTNLEIACMYSIKGVVFEGKEIVGYGCCGKPEECKESAPAEATSPCVNS